MSSAPSPGQAAQSDANYADELRLAREAAKNARRSPAAQKRRHRRFSADLGGAAHVGEDVVAGTLGAYAGTFDEGQFVIGNVIDFDLDSGTYTIA